MEYYMVITEALDPSQSGCKPPIPLPPRAARTGCWHPSLHAHASAQARAPTCSCTAELIVRIEVKMAEGKQAPARYIKAALPSA